MFRFVMKAIISKQQDMLDMVKNIWEALVNTPWWVYVIFVYVLIFGIRATKTRIVSLSRMFIIPIILIALSINELLTTVQPVWYNFFIWVIAILIGIYLGWLQIYHFKILIDRKKHLIQTPGTWTTLILLLIIFSTKYYFGYQLSIRSY